MVRALTKYILPLPVGGALGWATGATSGGSLPSALTMSAVTAWASVGVNWAPVMVAAGAGVATFFGVRSWLEGDRSEERDQLTHRLLSADIVERVETAIEAGTMSPEQKRRLAEKLKQGVLETSNATVAQAERFAETAVDLSQSANAVDRSVAEQVIEGRPEAAADRLVAEASAGKQRNASRFRQAARLYAPFAPSKAMEAYREAVELDPEDLWSWIELGRLRRHFGTLADARTCFNAALQRVAGERDRSVLHDEFGDLLLVEGELPEARTEFEADLAISARLARQEPANAEWQHDLFIIHADLAHLAEQDGNPAEALRLFKEGEAIMSGLTSAQPDHPGFIRDLNSVRSDIARLSS